MYLVTLVHLVYSVKSLNTYTHLRINTPGGQQRTIGFFPKLEMRELDKDVNYNRIFTENAENFYRTLHVENYPKKN